MATIYITEYASLAPMGTPTSIAQDPPVANQTKAIGGTTAQSNAFASNTRLIRVHTDAICSIEIGADPTATTVTRRLAANQTEYFGVKGGDKLAVISNT